METQECLVEPAAKTKYQKQNTTHVCQRLVVGYSAPKVTKTSERNCSLRKTAPGDKREHVREDALYDEAQVERDVLKSCDCSV